MASVLLHLCADPGKVRVLLPPSARPLREEVVKETEARLELEGTVKFILFMYTRKSLSDIMMFKLSVAVQP